MMMPLTNSAAAINGDWEQFELNYNIVLGPWLRVRPGLECDTGPSGYASRPNALVLGLSVKIIL